VVTEGKGLLAGRYRVGDVLGTGGMGTVVRAHDEVLDRAVAIKFLREDLAGDGPAAERFRREARIAASLGHPGIAQVYDFSEEEDGRPFIVMELLDGTDLQVLMVRGETFEPKVAAGIVASAGEALGYAHAAGAVHRDVKPGNIVLTRAGAVKVADFGIASAAQQVPLTETGKMLGTSWYVSPEQARGERAGPASDVYALGCVLYHLLAGRPPFEAETSVAVAMAHVSDPVPSVLDRNDAVPPALDAVARKAMAKDPVERYPDGAAMAKALYAAGAASRGGAIAAAGLTAGALVHPGIVPTGNVGRGPSTERLHEAPFAAAGAAVVAPVAPVPWMAADVPPAAAATASADSVQPVATGAGRRSRSVVAAGALLLLGVLLLAVFAMTRPDPPVVVPDWTGRSAQEASDEARKLGLRVRGEPRSSLETKDLVLAQKPAARAAVPPGSEIVLSVSLGDQVRVPDVTEGTLEDARSVLSAAGLRAEVAEVREHDDVSAMLRSFEGFGLDLGALGFETETVDMVVAQDQDPDAVVLRGSTVRLTIVRQPVEPPPGEDEGRGKKRKNEEDD
jgi:eukaryotic-like serine/threonine-protein kinase